MDTSVGTAHNKNHVAQEQRPVQQTKERRHKQIEKKSDISASLTTRHTFCMRLDAMR